MTPHNAWEEQPIPRKDMNPLVDSLKCQECGGACYHINEGKVYCQECFVIEVVRPENEVRS